MAAKFEILSLYSSEQDDEDSDDNNDENLDALVGAKYSKQIQYDDNEDMFLRFY